MFSLPAATAKDGLINFADILLIDARFPGLFVMLNKILRSNNTTYRLWGVGVDCEIVVAPES
jgi:hypothetical protein